MRARRVPLHDVYVEGEECVVFLDGVVRSLSARACHALAAVGESWTEDVDVALRLAAALGSPPAGLPVLMAARGTLLELADEGLVEVR